MKIHPGEEGMLINVKQIKYDKRSSCFVNTGTDYGVGKTNPVGKFKASNTPPWPENPQSEDVYKKA